jgi:5,10-methylenetetrahydrofolate reductase
MGAPDLLTALQTGRQVFAAELRPPRAELAAGEGMDAWIDTYHTVRSLTRQDTFVFLTDGAVGAQEEDNLRHLVTNLGPDAPRSRIVPFLTSKHSLEYCLSYAERARQHGFPALVVLGGDKSVGTPRSVEHAWQLRRLLRERDPAIRLGGWANPHSEPERQVSYLLEPSSHADFFLTQIVSHFQIDAAARFIDTAERRGLALPGLFGVFFYRSGSRRTLETLRSFLPVPIEGLTREFAEGLTAEDICARTIRALTKAGARHFYISNLPLSRAQTVMAAILEKAGYRAVS